MFWLERATETRIGCLGISVLLVFGRSVPSTAREAGRHDQPCAAGGPCDGGGLWSLLAPPGTWRGAGQNNGAALPHTVLVDVVPVEVEPQSGRLGDDQVPLVVDRVGDRLQVRRRARLVEAGAQQPVFVIPAGRLGRGAEELDVGVAGVVQLALDPVELAE